MNLIVLFNTDFIDDDYIRLTDRRYQHIVNTHQGTVGKTLLVGLLNGKIGKGTIQSINKEHLVMKVVLTDPPPKPLPLTLLIALPRPNMFARILQTCATFGVKEIIFFHSYRVEKNYWQSPQLSEQKVHENLLLGLEQGKDTRLPTVTFEKKYVPFINERLPSIIRNTTALVAHPSKELTQNLGFTDSTQEITLAIGPEGGFIDDEIQQFTKLGFSTISLGERILRVETAVIALLSKLFL